MSPTHPPHRTHYLRPLLPEAWLAGQFPILAPYARRNPTLLSLATAAAHWAANTIHSKNRHPRLGFTVIVFGPISIRVRVMVDLPAAQGRPTVSVWDTFYGYYRSNHGLTVEQEHSVIDIARLRAAGGEVVL